MASEQKLAKRARKQVLKALLAETENTPQTYEINNAKVLADTYRTLVEISLYV